MNPIEETFVKTFIARDRRERWLSFLGSEKNRIKVLGRLAHVFEDDLDPRFVFDKDSPPPEIIAQAGQALAEWTKTNPKQLCHLIVYGDKDGQLMNLSAAESDFDLTCGVIIIVIPNKLAYYHPERDNYSRQPFKLLFHP
ncbi:hypothetical protein [Armatimonas sp.]|uniref:hypothetical protein n=1 Tax=Armatimonas sp. TaxID=1872638 RepID=UPI00374DDF91